MKRGGWGERFMKEDFWALDSEEVVYLWSSLTVTRKKGTVMARETLHSHGLVSRYVHGLGHLQN